MQQQGALQEAVVVVGDRARSGFRRTGPRRASIPSMLSTVSEPSRRAISVPSRSGAGGDRRRRHPPQPGADGGNRRSRTRISPDGKQRRVGRHEALGGRARRRAASRHPCRRRSSRARRRHGFSSSVIASSRPSARRTSVSSPPFVRSSLQAGRRRHERRRSAVRPDSGRCGGLPRSRREGCRQLREPGIPRRSPLTDFRQRPAAARQQRHQRRRIEPGKPAVRRHSRKRPSTRQPSSEMAVNRLPSGVTRSDESPPNRRSGEVSSTPPRHSSRPTRVRSGSAASRTSGP